MFQIQRELEFSERLREAQAKVGLTQTEAAQAMNISRQMYNNWSHGYCKPKGARLRQLARVMQVDADWLQHGGSTEIEQRLEKATTMLRIAVRELDHLRQAISAHSNREES
jgi:transcriptional regulator with XRE-family HTH domain